jgi:signal transduction histidine kinase
MRALADIMQYANVVAFAALACVCYGVWQRERSDPARWAFLTFALLGAVSVAGAIIDAVAGSDPGVWLNKLVIALVVLFPYFLFRFAASFSRPIRSVEGAAALLTAILVVWTLALPDIPEEGEPRPSWFFAYIVALLIQWTTLSLYVAVHLWRAGKGQPTVVRYRMRFLALAAVALSLLLIALGVGPADPSATLEAVERLVTLAIAIMFFIGFAPPLFLREIWRRPEERVVREGIDQLVRFAATPTEIVTRVLPRMTRLVGARGISLLDENDAVLGTYGVVADAVERIEHESGIVRLHIASGSLVIWTDPYAPFFGNEEFALLRSLGSLTVLALERSRLFAQEHDARVALEEADELKAQFVALASHELRTPTAVVHGIASTLHLRGEELTHEQLLELRQTLFAQTDRLRRLVDQLLDLSRLEANAIRIAPTALPVRGRVEELVLMLAGERAREVSIDVPPDLHAQADPHAFDRIVSNLIINALRYGSGPIRVHAEQPDRYFRLTVEDQGRGVPREFVPRLFERFTRSSESDHEQGGAGLGLAIAQSFAHAHGGELLYEDADPHGARFKLVLPSTRNADRV